VAAAPSLAPLPSLPSLPPVSYQEFILDAFQPAASPAAAAIAYAPYGVHHHYGSPVQQPQQPPAAYHTYQTVAHPTAFYAQQQQQQQQQADMLLMDPKRHTVRSPVSGKFVRTEPPVKRQVQVIITLQVMYSTLIKKKTKFSSYRRKMQMGSGAKSYMREGLLEEMHKYFHHI
jgi:hypothetical protein